MITLNFLGRGAAFYPKFGNTNAWFAYGNDLFFLDFGEEAYHRVAGILPLEKYDHVYVILTHLHADHVGSLASLCSYMACVLHRTLDIIHPVDTVVQLLTLEGISKSFYRYATDLPENCPVQITPVEVQHAEDMKAFGYIVRSEEDAFYYSGDAAYLPEMVKTLYLDSSIDRIYHDTSSHESQSHCWYQRLEEAIPAEKREKVYCMHLDSDMVEFLQEKGFSVV